MTEKETSENDLREVVAGHKWMKRYKVIYKAPSIQVYQDQTVGCSEKLQIIIMIMNLTVGDR